MESDREPRPSTARARAFVTPTPHELRELAAQTAEAVGSQVRERRAGGFSWETKSTSTDVVTEIDTWAEAEVVRRLQAVRPDDGLLGEEGASSPGTTGIVWVIDPIDGTTNLLYDLQGFSVSIGALIDGEPVAGAVFDPVRTELFSAALGEGSTRNGDPIHVSESSDLATALIGTGFGYQADERARQATVLQTVVPKVRDIRRLGGAALDLCNVACGRLDAYFERGLSPWDWAAGEIIAREAGATVSVGDLTYAVGPGLETALLSLLEQSNA